MKTTNIFYDKPDRLESNVIEISSKDKNFLFNVLKILEIKEKLNGKDLSFHTGTSRIFSCHMHNCPEFNEAELNFLKAEIIACKIMGAKEFIFHMKHTKLTKDEEKLWQEVIDFAEKNGIEMIYESNQQFSGEVCLDFLKRFPDVNYNLDLGHFNTAIGNNTLGIDADEFISKIRDRVVYIHAHNNNGLRDEHLALTDGTLDWKHVLDMLDLSKVRKIIMEVKKTEDYIKTKRALDGYFRNKNL